MTRQIGLRRRETFGDGRRVVIYGQRTLDDRLAFGGRAGLGAGASLQKIEYLLIKGLGRFHVEQVGCVWYTNRLGTLYAFCQYLGDTQDIGYIRLTGDD